jgi:DNA-binding CsgD family transcriptional regulator
MNATNAGDSAPQEFGVDSTVRTAALDALSMDPTIAVTLLRDDGKILWANQQAAKLWAGESSTLGDYVGRNIRDLQPKEWDEPRQEMFSRVKSTGRPVVLRVMWKGRQYFSLFRLVKGSLLEHDRYLIVTRHVPSGEKFSTPTDSTYELIEADTVGLGHLDVLTPREVEVLALIGQGMSTREISQMLSRSEKTIENHRYAISKKLESSSPVRLAEIARQAGLTVKDAERNRIS